MASRNRGRAYRSCGRPALVAVCRSNQRGNTIRTAIVGTVLGATLALVPAAANAAPCEAHTGKAKAACIHQVKRDRMAWPPAPRAWEIQRRVGFYNWNKAHRVAVCETGKRLDWYPTGRFRGPLGMYVTTQAVGIRITGYSPPRTWPEHVAVAVASHGTTRGWSGWGCGSA
jgi:hypothetical protein